MTQAADSSPNRRAVSLAVASGGVALLAISLAVVVGLFVFAQPSCGCTSAPDPNATPTPRPPVSSVDAGTAASKLVGLEMETGADTLWISGVPVYQAQSGPTEAFVDGNDGRVIAAVWLDRLPANGEASGPSGQAYQTGLVFLSRAGLSVDGLVDAQTLSRAGAAVYYDLTWSRSGAKIPDIEVLVTPSATQVFGFRDLRGPADLAIPVFGADSAWDAARQSTMSRGETPTPLSPDEIRQNLLMEPFGDGITWVWQVGFPDGVLQVDAVTGQVTVGKWAE